MGFQEESVVSRFAKEFKFANVVVNLKVIITSAAIEIGVVAHTGSDTITHTVPVGVRVVDHLHSLAINSDRRCAKYTADHKVVVPRISINIDGCCRVIGDEGVVALAPMQRNTLGGVVVIDALERTGITGR